jgi:hypothetical protein
MLEPRGLAGGASNESLGDQLTSVLPEAPAIAWVIGNRQTWREAFR